jgi:hypothetical protein
MSIHLVDLRIKVNGCGRGNMPSFALFDCQINATSDDQAAPPKVAGAGHWPNTTTPDTIIQMSWV